MAEFLRISLAFGTIFAFLLSLVQWVKPKRGFSEMFLSLVFLSGSALCGSAYANVGGIRFDWEFLGFYHIPFTYLAGPAVYYFYYSTVQSDFGPRRRDWMAFLPAVLLAVALPIIYLANAAAFPDDPMDWFYGGPFGWAEAAFVGGFVFNSIYAVLLVRRAHLIFDYRFKKTNKSARLFLGILSILALIVVLAVVAVVGRQVELLHGASFLIVISMVLAFVFSQRYPEYFSRLAAEIENQDLQKHILDAQKDKFRRAEPIELHIELTRLMLDERLYESEDLNINTVAEKLDIKPYVLSEFLNNYLKINFSQFVKNFRVEAAKDMLRKEPDANFLTVAYRAGFNSKTTFNVSFKQVTGYSPREFVKNHKAKLARAGKQKSGPPATPTGPNPSTPGPNASTTGTAPVTGAAPTTETARNIEADATPPPGPGEASRGGSASAFTDEAHKSDASAATGSSSPTSGA